MRNRKKKQLEEGTRPSGLSALHICVSEEVEQGEGKYRIEKKCMRLEPMSCPCDGAGSA